MPKFIPYLISFIMGFAVLNITFQTAFADHGEGKKGNCSRHRSERKHHGVNDKDHLRVVTNPIYSENCSACHLAYPSDLLPSASWNQIMNGLENHFGETVTMDSGSTKLISEYLTANSADASSNEYAVKIRKSAEGQTPARITEVPYIQKKHHELGKDVLGRQSIASLSNCAACHPGAAKGNFDDDAVKMPK